MQEDSFAGKGLLPQPQRNRKRATLGRQSADPPARFVAVPSGGEIAQGQEGNALNEPRRRKVRPDAQRPPRTHCRFPRAIEPSQRDRAVGEKLNVARRKLQRPIIGGERFSDPIELEQRVAAITEGIEVVRIGGKRAIDTAERFRVAAEFQKCDAATIEQFDIIGRKPQPLVRNFAAPARIA